VMTRSLPIRNLDTWARGLHKPDTIFLSRLHLVCEVSSSKSADVVSAFDLGSITQTGLLALPTKEALSPTTLQSRFFVFSFPFQVHAQLRDDNISLVILGSVSEHVPIKYKWFHRGFRSSSDIILLYSGVKRSGNLYAAIKYFPLLH
jgi:hypothetical protein